MHKNALEATKQS